MSVQVADNFLDEDLINMITQTMQKCVWLHNHSSIINSNHHNSRKFWMMNFEHDTFLKYTLLKKIESTFNKKYEIVRMYMNGQTYGQHGSYHRDVSCQTDNAYTFLIYCSPEITTKTVDEIGGYTHFKCKNEIITIEPLYKRAVMFDSNLEHKGCAPESYNILRQSLAIKLIEIN